MGRHAGKTDSTGSPVRKRGWKMVWPTAGHPMAWCFLLAVEDRSFGTISVAVTSHHQPRMALVWMTEWPHKTPRSLLCHRISPFKQYPIAKWDKHESLVPLRAGLSATRMPQVEPARAARGLGMTWHDWLLCFSPVHCPICPANETKASCGCRSGSLSPYQYSSDRILRIKQQWLFVAHIRIG